MVWSYKKIVYEAVHTKADIDNIITLIMETIVYLPCMLRSFNPFTLANQSRVGPDEVSPSSEKDGVNSDPEAETRKSFYPKRKRKCFPGELMIGPVLIS